MGADLSTFGPGARRHVQSRLAKAAMHAATMEDAARAVCRVLRYELADVFTRVPAPSGHALFPG